VAFLSSILAERERIIREELSIMEENVKRVEKMAAMGEMAAGLAHEIKNPLASLSGSIQLLRESGHYDSDQNKLMKIILREADRLSSLVNEFLLFAKPQQGRIEVLDLNEILAETLELFENDHLCRGRITTIKELSPDINVEIDPGHLQQVLWNLLLNAAEAIEGSGTIAVKLYSLYNNHACIEITDDGCGIPRSNIKSIFDPFFTTKKKGAGLGLSIVYRILETYSALLDVKSEPGEGTVFTVKMLQAE